MIADLTRYGAVTAKVRAMYGMRLRGEDYDRMSLMTSVADVAEFLRGHPVWGDALAHVDAASVHREEIEARLRRHSLTYALRLFLYMRREDRAVMRYPVLTAEMEQVMRFMRYAAAGRAAEYSFDMPDIVGKLSRVRFDLLSKAGSYDDMLEALRNTEFYNALKRLRPDNGAYPPYLLVETQMRRGYFHTLSEMLRIGRGKEQLREAVGIQADWINIALIDRILRYYPQLMPDIFQYLLPAGAHLKPVELRTMISIDNADALRGLLERTHYAPYLAGREADSLEVIGQICLITFYRRRMMSGAPSIFIPIAYINLFQSELQNIIHTIESVRYGLPPAVIGKTIVLA